MLCTIIDRRTRLLPQPCLNLLPDRSLNDDRIEIFVAKPVRFADGSRFAAEIFPAVIDQNAGIGFLHQNVFHTGIRPEKLPVTGLVRLLAVITNPLRHDLRRRFASETVEPAGDFFLPAALQVQSVDKLYRLRCVLMHHNLIRIFVFPVSEGRRDYQSLFLLLPVACADFLSDVFCIIIIHQTSDADHKIIFLTEGIHTLRYGDDPHLLLSQVVNKQCGLGSMPPQP